MPRAVLVHGLSATPASLWRWRTWLEARGWAVADHSPLGHAGRGAAPSYALGAHAEDLERTGPWDLVVGHSLGGAMVAIAADREPGWAARTVAVDPAWHISAELLPAVRSGELAELALTRAALHADHGDWDPRDIDAKLLGISTVLPEAVEGVFDDNPVWDVRAEAGRVTVPTLLITGDPAVFTLLDPADAALVSANPLVTWRPIAGAGHAPHRDRPEATMTVFEEWLAV